MKRFFFIKFLQFSLCVAMQWRGQSSSLHSLGCSCCWLLRRSRDGRVSRASEVVLITGMWRGQGSNVTSPPSHFHRVWCVGHSKAAKMSRSWRQQNTENSFVLQKYLHFLIGRWLPGCHKKWGQKLGVANVRRYFTIAGGQVTMGYSGLLWVTEGFLCSP